MCYNIATVDVIHYCSEYINNAKVHSNSKKTSGPRETKILTTNSPIVKFNLSYLLITAE